MLCGRKARVSSLGSCCAGQRLSNGHAAIGPFAKKKPAQGTKVVEKEPAILQMKLKCLHLEDGELQGL